MKVKESEACPLVLIDTTDNTVYLSKHIRLAEDECETYLEGILNEQFDLPKSFQTIDAAERYAKCVSNRMDELYDCA